MATKQSTDVVLSEVTLDTIGTVEWHKLTEAQQAQVRAFRLDPNGIAKADLDPANVALMVRLQKDYATEVERVGMVNAGLFVFNVIERGLVGEGKTFKSQRALAEAIDRSEGYISRLKVIGKAAALGVEGPEMSHITTSPGAKLTDAFKSVKTKTQAKAAAKRLVTEAKASGAEKGKGSVATPRKASGKANVSEKGDGRSGRSGTDVKGERPERTLAHARVLLASLTDVIAGLSEADLRTVIGETHAMLDNETDAREATAAKATATK